MKRKFSFDMPRLKIGPTKADTKALRDQLNNNFPAYDSPPPTPKSVRPPLSPKTDAELRASCAYVLQNFKPSYAVFQDAAPAAAQPTAAAGQKPQLDYAAIKETSLSVVEVGPLLQPTNTNVQSPDLEEDNRGRNARREPTKRNKSADSPIQSSESLSKPRLAILRADELMGSMPTKTAHSSRSGTHTRNDSNSQSVLSTAFQAELVQRPKIPQYNAPSETEGSTPFTESTDYPWSDRASTAMTSAMMTPARSSKRTSSQAVPSGSESGSMSKGMAVDADWIRQELEKHKKAQEGFGQNEKLQEEPEVAEPVVVSATAKAIRRKPIPASAHVVTHESEARVDDRENQITQRSGQQPDESGPSDVRRSRSRAASRAASRARSISRGVKEYFRPRSVYQTENETEPAPDVPLPSRSRTLNRSVSRRVLNYVRPETASSSRKPSVDFHRSASKAASVRSTASGRAPSITSVTKQWRSWRRGSQDSQRASDVEANRSGSATVESRGRDPIRGLVQKVKRKSKVDLNRELPPLPSLDMWNNVDKERPQNNRASDSKDSVMSYSSLQAKSPVSRYVQADDHQPQAVQAAYPVHPRTYQSSEEHAMSPETYVPSRRAMTPTQRYIPGSARDSVGTASSSSELQDHRQRWPVHGMDGRETIESRGRQRARTARGAPPLSYKEPQVLTGSQQSPVEKPVNNDKVQSVNFSRPNVLLSASVSRTVLQEDQSVIVQPSSVSSQRHSRTLSDQVVSRGQYSTDEQPYKYDDGYHNMIEIGSRSFKSTPSPLHSKEKSKWKWWQNKQKRQETWMDSVISSGSSSGIMIADEGAAAPIVKY